MVILVAEELVAGAEAEVAVAMMMDCGVPDEAMSAFRYW